MCINTTINIKPELLAIINDISLSFDIPTDEIIAILIKKTMHKTEIEPCMFETVKYQAKNKTIKWRKLHIPYFEDVYEEANDLRKILKRSVSRIIAEGIIRFLDEIIRDLSNNIRDNDNYPHNYIFGSNIYKGINYFSIFWGCPPLKFLKRFIN